jgi:hypothetical protein
VLFLFLRAALFLYLRAELASLCAAPHEERSGAWAESAGALIVSGCSSNRVAVQSRERTVVVRVRRGANPWRWACSVWTDLKVESMSSD